MSESADETMDVLVLSLVEWMQEERFHSLTDYDQKRVRLATEAIILLRRQLRHTRAQLLTQEEMYGRPLKRGLVTHAGGDLS